LRAKHCALIDKGIAGFRIEASRVREKEEILPFVPLTAFAWWEMYRMLPEDGPRREMNCLDRVYSA
jgi:hypothetical protein